MLRRVKWRLATSRGSPGQRRSTWTRISPEVRDSASRIAWTIRVSPTGVSQVLGERSRPNTCPPYQDPEAPPPPESPPPPEKPPPPENPPKPPRPPHEINGPLPRTRLPPAG